MPDPSTIILILLGAVVAGVLIFFDNAMDRILNPILRLVGLNSSMGPLACSASRMEGSLAVTIENQGPTQASIVSVVAIDPHGKKFYPVPFPSEQAAGSDPIERNEPELRKQLLSTKIQPGESQTVHLCHQELEGCDPGSLQVMDTHGKSWPVS